MSENYVYVVTQYDRMLDHTFMVRAFSKRLAAYDFISKLAEDEDVIYEVKRLLLDE